MTSATRQKKDEKLGNEVLKLHRYLDGLLILLSSGIICLAAISRISIKNLPLSRDEGAYGYLGKMAMKGHIPYLDFYEMKPPLLYYFYGIGGSIFGFTESGLRMLALALTMLSTILVFIIVRKYASSSISLLCAACYSVLSLNMFCMGYSMIAEHFINVLLLAGITTLLSKINTVKLIISGMLFGMAVLVKQVVFIFIIFFIFLIFLRNKEGRFKSILAFVSGGFIIFTGLILYLWQTNSIDQARYWLFEYPREYSTSNDFESGYNFFIYFFKNIALFSPMITMLTFLGMVSSIFYFRQKLTKSWIIYLILAVVSLIPGLRFYGQYWLLLLPPIAMSNAFAVNLFNSGKLAMGSIFAVLLALVMILEFKMNERYYFNAKPSKQMDKLYDGNPFEAIKAMSLYSKSLMKPEDKLLMLGSEPQVYLYIGKDSPSKHVYTAFMAKQSDSNKKLRNEMMSEFENSRPEYVLFNLFPYSWLLTKEANDELYKNCFTYTVNNYVAIASFDIDRKNYLYREKGEEIDVYKANQIILFKRR